MRNATYPCLTIQPLGIARTTYGNRRIDKYFAKWGADYFSCEFATVPSRRYDSDNHDVNVAKHDFCHMRGPPHILEPVIFTEPEVFVQFLAQFVSVKDRARYFKLEKLLFERAGNGALAGA